MMVVFGVRLSLTQTATMIPTGTTIATNTHPMTIPATPPVIIVSDLEMS